ncbi:MAG: alpha/beta fold hydrolase, partial [Actinobacteria bacterium]|nr:alpha/beta fold hydrolase [Actinomycetota bacterium]
MQTIPQVVPSGEDYGLPPSRWADLDGPVHYREWDGPGDLTFVCVHGLGGSLLNWMAVAPQLSSHGRVVALDLAGFGHTPSAGRSASLFANRRLLSRFLREVVPERPVVLIGNSMGGGIAMLQAGVEPASIDGLVLTDPILPVASGGFPAPIVIFAFMLYRIPRIGERFLHRRVMSMTPEEFMDQSLKVIAARPDTIPRDVYRAHLELAESRRNVDHAIPAFLEAARSLLSLGTRPLMARRILDRIRVPVLMVHGQADR